MTAMNTNLRIVMPILIGVLVLSAMVMITATAHAEEKGFFGPIVPDCKPTECGEAELQELAANVFNLMISIGMAITVIFVLWGGFTLLTSGGSVDRIASGKKTITAAIVGLVIILVAWAAVNILITFFTDCSGNWWQFGSFDCG